MRQATPGNNFKDKEATEPTLKRLPMKSSTLISQRSCVAPLGTRAALSCAASVPFEALTDSGLSRELCAGC